MEKSKKEWTRYLPEKINFEEAKQMIVAEYHRRAGTITHAAKLMGLARITVRKTLRKIKAKNQTIVQEVEKDAS